MPAPLVPVLFALGFFVVLVAVGNILVGDHCRAMRTSRQSHNASLDAHRGAG